jgi:hypothetical protein
MRSPIEPVIFGLTKWATVGAMSGVTYAVAAVQANPETAALATPDLKTSLYALSVAVVGYVLKSYAPSEKKVDTQFEELNTGHKTLTDRLEDFAFEARTQTGELRAHRIELAQWIGGVDAKLTHISDRQDRFDKKLENLK